MSADNGIYVLYTESKQGPEYRVAYAHGIGNIYGEWDDLAGRYSGNPDAIQETFGASPVFFTIDEAMTHAETMEQDYDYLEDGVALIKEFKDYGHIFER